MAEQDGHKHIKLCGDITADNLQDLVRQIDPMDVLAALANGLSNKQDKEGQLSSEDDKRFTELVDLMWYVEISEDGPPPGDNNLPVSDQFTLIDRQVCEGLITDKEGRELSRELIDQFEQAMAPGVALQDQYKRLHEILRTFNPARKLVCG